MNPNNIILIKEATHKKFICLHLYEMARLANSKYRKNISG